MLKSLTRRVGCAALAMSLALSFAAPAAAQYAASTGVGVQESPEAALARNLRILASDPRNFAALNAAGRAALATGDTQAAAGFFGRAAEVSPRSWQPQAGMAAAMTEMGDPQGAMTYFGQAQAFGAVQILIALDRGLAFDLLGDQAKAQSDYRVALAGADPDEARRRLALSLAISRDIRGANAMLDPLLRRGDAQALRIKAFILALAGDRDGARRTIDTAMPGAGARFDPFFQVFPLLQPAEKAAAVHLGIFPKDAATRYASVQPIPSAPAPATSASRPRFVEAVPKSEKTTAPARKPQSSSRQAKKPPPKPLVNSARDPFYSSFDPINQSSARRQAERPSADPKTTVQVQPQTVAQVAPPPQLTRQLSPPPQADRLTGIEDLLQRTPEPAPARDEPLVRVAEAEPPEPGLSIDLPPAVSKPKIESARPKPAVDRKAKAEADKKAKAEAEKKAKAEAERKAQAEAAKLGVAGTNWVQLAGGANKDNMAAEYRKLAAKAGSVLKSRSGYVTEGKDYFRLLVGPFKTTDEAQDFVRKLDKAGVDSFRWTRNPAQIRIEKLKS